MAQKNKTTTIKLPTATASGSKRRLDFDDGSQTLKDKTFFLDLNGYRNQDELERELTRRGGLVEKFFDVGVKYLVTNRSHDDSSTPSPRSLSIGKSPLESVSPVEPRKKPAHYTRAAMMVAASKRRSGSKKTVDLVAMAKSWGCKVISLDALLAELKRLKPLPKKGGGKPKVNFGVVHQLKVPYLKVEDQSRGYKPLIHESKTWPCARHTSSPHSCPFDIHKTSSYCSGFPSPDRPRPSHPMITRSRKPGYCECCLQRYEDLPMHLRSGKHSEYARNNSNYTTLDRLISRGMNYEAFIRQLRRSPLRSFPPNGGSAVRSMTPPSHLRSPRQPEVLSPFKKITLGAFASPKTGQLRITPLKTDVEQTPGFATKWSFKMETQETIRTPIAPIRKRCLETEEGKPPSKRHCSDNDCVPETPVKPGTNYRSRSRSPACCALLANLNSLLERRCVTPPPPPDKD